MRTTIPVALPGAMTAETRHTRLTAQDIPVNGSPVRNQCPSARQRKEHVPQRNVPLRAQHAAVLKHQISHLLMLAKDTAAASQGTARERTGESKVFCLSKSHWGRSLDPGTSAITARH